MKRKKEREREKERERMNGNMNQNMDRYWKTEHQNEEEKEKREEEISPPEKIIERRENYNRRNRMAKVISCKGKCKRLKTVKE